MGALDDWLITNSTNYPIFAVNPEIHVRMAGMARCHINSTQ
jgi:hypothetical protein